MDEWQESIERDLVRYYEMNEVDRAMYRRKLMRQIEDGHQASAEILTEKLIARCQDD